MKKSEEKRQKKKSSKTACLSHFQGLVCGRGRRTRTLGTRFWSAIFNFLSFFAISNNRIGKPFLALLIFVASHNFDRLRGRINGQ
ncbi:hypothetical protein ACTQ2N_08645 [Ruminococcus sp. LCP21S3_E8]